MTTMLRWVASFGLNTILIGGACIAYAFSYEWLTDEPINTATLIITACFTGGLLAAKSE